MVEQQLGFVCPLMKPSSIRDSSLSVCRAAAAMEEAGSCTSLTLPLRAGCTAPPPTPVRRPEPADAIAAHHHHEEDEADRSCEDDDGSRHQSSTPPSRAELDELARYLMQQLPPTLLMRRKPKASPRSDEAAMARSRDEEQKLQSLLAARRGGLSVHAFCAEQGLFNDGKMGILRACEEEGAFYVQSTVTDIGTASCSQIDGIFKQCPAVDGMCVIGSYPLVSLSQLMTWDYSREPGDISSHRQEDGSFETALDFSSAMQNTSFAEAEMDSRNPVTVLANLLVKISKELLKFLLEELCCKDHLQGHFIKPVLYMCKRSGNEPAKCDKDVILSITSADNASDQGYNERNMLLVVLGSYIQSWSEERFKTPSLFSSGGLADEKICLQLDLVYHI